MRICRAGAGKTMGTLVLVRANVILRWCVAHVVYLFKKKKKKINESI